MVEYKVSTLALLMRVHQKEISLETMIQSRIRKYQITSDAALVDMHCRLSSKEDI